MTLPIQTSSSHQALDRGITLKIQLKESLRRIEKKLADVQVHDGLVATVTDWKNDFHIELQTNRDLNPIISIYANKIVQILEAYEPLKAPLQKMDARHHLVESLIYFVKTYETEMLPQQLEELFHKIQDVKLKPQLTEEQDQAIQAIQARNTQAEKRRQAAEMRPARLSPNIHTLQSIQERVEKDTLENMKKIDELERQLTPMNMSAVLESLKAFEEQNRLISAQAEEQIQSVLQLEQFYNPFSDDAATHEHVIQIPKNLVDTMQRRKIRADLLSLREAIRKNNMGDLLENTVWKWGDKLWDQLLRNVHDEIIFRDLFLELSQSLVNVFNLDTRNLSSHPVLQYLERWLQNYDAKPVLETIESYKVKMDMDQIDRLKALYAERENEKTQSIAAKKRQVQDRIDARMSDVIAPMDHTRRLNNGVAEVIGEELHQMAVEDEVSANEQIIAMKALDEDRLELDRRNAAIARRLDSSEQNVTELAQENMKVQIATNKVKNALKKQKKNGIKTLVKTAAIVTACALATWGLGVTVAPNASGAIVIVPI